MSGSIEGQNRVSTSDGSNRENPEAIANHFLDRLQVGYENADISLITGLYNDPVAAVDITRDEHRFYTASSLQAEMTQALAGLTERKCRFTDRQISAEGDMIMIRTLRSVTANEIPITANCLMLMILRKQFLREGPGEYVVTDQILLKEEYIPKSES